MGKKLILLGAAVAAFALWGAHAPWGSVPTASADPWSATMNLGMVACGATDPLPCNLDANQDTGEVVTTYLDTALPSNHGSFYDAPETQITGLAIQAGIPMGDTVGSDQFTIYVGDASCSNASLILAASFTIYNTPISPGTVTPGTNYPLAGYAKGMVGDPNPWSTYAATWVADFDDDNENNTPDYEEVGPIIPAGAWSDDSYPESTQDHRNASGTGAADTIVDGIQRAPLYLPVEEAALGATAGTRFFGVANILSGANLVPVDFVTFPTLPGGGTETQIAVIGQGSGAGLLAGSPASSGTVTCPPFTSKIQIDGKSGTGAAVQRITGSGGYLFRGSVTADWDGDGVPNYQDNCDTVWNPIIAPATKQLDTDNDGIGDACDANATVPDGTVGCVVSPTSNTCDADTDGYLNANDSCPYSAVTADGDKDGIPNGCDPNPTVEGDGHGYQNPPPGLYMDHDWTDLDTFTAGANEGIGSPPGDVVQTTFTDANDNHIPDSLDSASDSDGDGLADNVDADPLDPTNQNRFSICAAAPGGADCDWDSAYPFFVGDGCPDSEEPAKSIGGTPLSGANPWDFYAVPQPALFAAPSPTTTFRTSTIGAAGAQGIFGYYKKGAKEGTLVYDQDLNLNKVPDGVEYDRKLNGLLPTNGPDGTIGAAEAQKAFSEYKAGLKCSAGNGYRLND